MKNKQQKKAKQPKRDFAEILAEKLGELGEVEAGKLGDGSGRWVTIRISKKKELNFSFNMKGNEITGIALYKDVIEVTEQKQLFSLKREEEEPVKMQNVPQPYPLMA